MDAQRLGSGNRMCSVVFADIVEYSQKHVSQQVMVKTQFSAFLAAALSHTAVADRLVVDTGDGAALCFLGDPEDALFTANSLRSLVLESPEPSGMQLRLGINLGPVRVAQDVNGHTNVIGDGINIAQRVMSFAGPNQILVSRSFYEVVSRLSPEYAQLFHYAGLHKDKHVREHEVYEVQLSGTVTRRDAAAPRAEVAESRAHIDTAVISRLSAALAREIGPVAKVLVGRAADGIDDLSALCVRVSESVPESRRAAFLASLADIAKVPQTRTRREEGTMSGQRTVGAAQGPGEIGPEVLARAEQTLARHIGPLARILVREAAKKATNVRELFEDLATHIDNAEDRTAFIGEVQPS